MGTRSQRCRDFGLWTPPGSSINLKRVAGALVISELRKRYGRVTAIDGISLDVSEGEIFGIVGPNGSGKTTTAECAQGLRRPDSGTVRVFGVDPHARPGRMAGLVGTQLQDSALPDRIKVWEAVHLFGAMCPDPVDEASILDEWGLTGKRTASYASLSGGQRQRLLVALALVARPRLVFLDEMTTGLDPAGRREAWRVIEQVRERGTTVVLVTHFMDEAERLCDRIAVVVDGRVVDVATPGELVVRYGGSGVARFDHVAALDLDALRRLTGVREVTRRDGTVEVSGDAAFLTALGHALTEAGWPDTVLRVWQPRLEDVYLELVAQARADRAGGEVA